MQTGNLPDHDPERSLGRVFEDFAGTYIRQPDGPQAGNPFELTCEQLRFVRWFYAIRPDGGFKFRRATLRRAKGWGKSPLIAALAIFEMLGRCRVEEAGAGRFRPVSIGTPWIQLAAVSEYQARNVMDSVRGMLVESAAVRDFGLDLGKNMIQFADGRPGKIEIVTSSSSTLEGGRPTFASGDEPHVWTEATGGHRLVAVLRRNLGKTGGRLIMPTNAFQPGQDSVAEREYEAFLSLREGRTKNADFLYDCVEPARAVDLSDSDALLAALAEAYGDATWVDLERVRDEIWDPTSEPGQMRRFYLNEVVVSDTAWLDPADVKRAVEVREAPAEGAVITLGFDGSVGSDATVLIGCDVETGWSWPLGIWQKPDGPEAAGWQVPREHVDEVTRAAFGRWRVAAMFADVAFWESYVDAWARDLGDSVFMNAAPSHAFAFDMRRRLREFTAACESTRSDFQTGQIGIADSAQLRRHLINATPRENPYGTGIGKESRTSDRKIDAAVGLILAREARRRAIHKGVREKWKPRSGRVYGF